LYDGCNFSWGEQRMSGFMRLGHIDSTGLGCDLAMRTIAVRAIVPRGRAPVLEKGYSILVVYEFVHPL
jgi:hypothetical protein